LYYYGGGWVCSTKKGIAVDGLSWDGVSYKQALTDVLTQNEIKVEDFYGALNKSSSYTFGFKHPGRHPFREGECKIDKKQYQIWFVQSAELATGKVERSISPVSKILPQEMIQIQNVRDLFRINFNAYTEFQASGKVDYGFLLRATSDDVPFNCRSLLLESKLLQKIRIYFYQSQYTEVSNILGISRRMYIVVRSYLKYTMRTHFITLFPQFKPAFAAIKKIIETLADTIIKLSLKNLIASDKPKIIITYAKYMEHTLSEKFSIKDNTPTTHLTVCDYLSSAEFTGAISTIYLKLNGEI
jgi:hypothetical protein